MKIKIAAFLVALTLAIASPAAAATKAGATCPTLNKTAVVGGVTLKCTAKSGKKVWVAQAKAYGTLSNPTPVGTALKAGDWQITVNDLTDDASEAVCAANMFNSGCTTDDVYNSVVDPASDKRWVRIGVTIVNRGKSTDAPVMGDVGILSKGRIYWNGIFQPTTDEIMQNSDLIPGGSIDGALFVNLPKSVAVGTIAIKTVLFSSNIYYFKKP
jgi:hypothetical protein